MPHELYICALVNAVALCYDVFGKCVPDYEKTTPIDTLREQLYRLLSHQTELSRAGCLIALCGNGCVGDTNHLRITLACLALPLLNSAVGVEDLYSALHSSYDKQQEAGISTRD